jgi:integrase
MPRRRSPPRLYLDPKRDQWIIRDGPSFIRTGASEGQRQQAEKALHQYIGLKYTPAPSATPLIADVLTIYAEEVAPHRKSARNTAYHIGNLLKWWGTKTVADINTKSCRSYVRARMTNTGAAADIKILKAAFIYWNKEKHPLNVVPTFWQPKANPPKDRWLTRTEAARLLNAARGCLHLRRQILLQLYTGSRPGVVLTLKWDQVDLTAGVMHRLPRGAAQDAKKRAPPVKLGRRISAHLRRWKRLDGPSLNDVCHYKGTATKEPHSAWDRAVRVAGLTGTGVTPHTLRHTRATWMMHKGVDLWSAAGFLGMTVKTLEAVYGHHHPDHQDAAANI